MEDALDFLNETPIERAKDAAALRSQAAARPEDHQARAIAADADAETTTKGEAGAGTVAAPLSLAHEAHYVAPPAPTSAEMEQAMQQEVDNYFRLQARRPLEVIERDLKDRQEQLEWLQMQPITRRLASAARGQQALLRGEIQRLEQEKRQVEAEVKSLRKSFNNPSDPAARRAATRIHERAGELASERKKHEEERQQREQQRQRQEQEKRQKEEERLRAKYQQDDDQGDDGAKKRKSTGPKPT